jgi:phage shock protein E
MMSSLLFPIFASGAILLGTLSTSADTTTNERSSRVASPGIRKVGVEEFEKLWKAKTNVVLDVRTRKEFDAGHIPGAKNLDVNQPDFEKKASTLDKDKVYLVHCAAGVRSARACDKLHGLGFQNLIDLAPGFKAWQKAGKQVEK